MPSLRAVCGSTWPCASVCSSPRKPGDPVTALELARPATMTPDPVAGLALHVPRGNVLTRLDGIKEDTTADVLDELSDL
jgi:hypothetical protein